MPQPARAATSKRLLPMYRNIDCAFDGSEGARRALDVTRHMARADKQELSTIFIEEMLRYLAAPAARPTRNASGRTPSARKLRQEAIDTGEKFGVEAGAQKRLGHPAKTLVHFVKEASIDLLVMATAVTPSSGTLPRNDCRQGRAPGRVFDAGGVLKTFPQQLPAQASSFRTVELLHPY